MIETVIDAIDGSRKRFTKTNYEKIDRVRNLQHVSAFPANANLVNSCFANSIKNNPITKRDSGTSVDILGPSKHMPKGNSAREQPHDIDRKLQTTEVLPTIRQ